MRIFLCVAAPWLGALPCHAAAARIVGAAEVPFEGKASDAAARAAGLNQAKQDALENYVNMLPSSDFPALRYRLWLDNKSRIDASIDQYLTDISILDQGSDAARHRYRVKISATINQARFDAATTLSGPESPK